jgi:broad specificity phosphatase PhoE
MALTLFLLRHGMHDQPADMLCGTRAGVSLSAAGRAEAALLSRRFPPGSLDMLLTSPLQRCEQTAALVGAACGVEAQQEPSAREVEFGAWTGQRFAALEQDARWHVWNHKRDEASAPGGEAMRMVQARVLGLLKDLLQRQPSGRVAIVSHAEIIRTAILHVLGLPLQAYDRVEVALASISTVALWPGGGKLVGLNDVAHLRATELVAA